MILGSHLKKEEMMFEIKICKERTLKVDADGIYSGGRRDSIMKIVIAPRRSKYIVVVNKFESPGGNETLLLGQN